MQETGMAAVGKFVLWGKENLCLIRAQGETLAMETLFFADDVRSKAEIEEAVEAVDLKDAELQLAEQVIDSLVGEWKPEDFENEYRRDLKAMLDAKLAGEKITRPEPVAETPVVDLMEALRRSVAEVQDKKAAPKARKTGSQKTAAEKTKATPAPGDGSRRKAPARK
jgi:DNA end-binding protein Ku